MRSIAEGVHMNFVACMLLHSANEGFVCGQTVPLCPDDVEEVAVVEKLACLDGESSAY